MIDIDDFYSREFTTRNTSGVVANAASTACTITLPDQTVATPTVTNTGTGTYRIDFQVTQYGHHKGRFTSTYGSEPFTFDVGELDAIVSIDDAKRHLNITSSTHDEELREVIAAATQWVENRVGPVVRRSVTETLYGHNSPTLLLSNAPVLSLTSVVGANGYTATYDVNDLYLDGPTGAVSAGYFGPLWGAYPLTVTYVVGRTVVPAAIRLAALMMVKALWETQRGASPLPIPGFDENVEQGGMGLVVWRAEQLLAPYARPAVVA